MHAVSSTLPKPADKLTVRFENIKKRFCRMTTLVECCGAAHNIEWDILDACRRVEK